MIVKRGEKGTAVVTGVLLIVLHQITQELSTVIYAWAATRLLFIQMGKENVVDVTVEAEETEGAEEVWMKEAEEARVEGMPMST